MLGRQDIIINSQVLPNDNLDQSKGMTKKSERLSNIRTQHIKLTLPIDKDIKQPKLMSDHQNNEQYMYK